MNGIFHTISWLLLTACKWKGGGGVGEEGGGTDQRVSSTYIEILGLHTYSSVLVVIFILRHNLKKTREGLDKADPYEDDLLYDIFTLLV